MTLPFRAAVEQLEGGVLVLNLVGELDHATVPELERTLDELIGNGIQSLVVDLSDCGFIDSSGLSALVSARERLQATGDRRFGVCCPDAQVRRLFEITGLDKAMDVVATRDEAVHALQGADA